MIVTPTSISNVKRTVAAIATTVCMSVVVGVGIIEIKYSLEAA